MDVCDLVIIQWCCFQQGNIISWCWQIIGLLHLHVHAGTYMGFYILKLISYSSVYFACSLSLMIIRNRSAVPNYCVMHWSIMIWLHDCILYVTLVVICLLSFSIMQYYWNILCFPLRLQEYSVETAIAIVIDGSANLKINTQHLRDLTFRAGSIYQFIGELLIQPDNEVWVHD